MSRPTGSITVKVMKNGTGEAIQLNDAQKAQLVAAATAAVEGHAKQHLQQMVYAAPVAPSGYVRTGNLMNSVGHELLPTGDGIVFASAEYAVYVHEGTVHTDPRPFLEEALKDEQRRLPARARRIANGGTS